MSGKKRNADSSSRTVALNRRARHDYELLDEWEAGICLVGTEVKSLRTGKAQIAESYAEERGGELYLINSYIPEYGKASSKFNHEARRPRKLLLHKKEINKVMGKLRNKGLTLIPTALYFNAKGIAKVKLALGRGKTKYDKRETEKTRAWERDKARLMREHK